MSPEEIIKGRIYPAIQACVANRYKIIVGLFSVYVFIVSSKDKIFISKDILLFAAWIFTFFVVHNSANYMFNAWEQYDLEPSENDKRSKTKKVWELFNVEGITSIVMLIFIWWGYFIVLESAF